MKHGKFIILEFSILLILLTGCQVNQTKEVQIQNGILDLSDWNFSEDGIIKLDGKWEFYWNNLIFPGDIHNVSALTGYYDVPGYWTRYSNLHLPSKGYATYRLKIITDGNKHLLSIITPELYTEYNLWINDKLIDSNLSTDLHQASYLCPDVYDFCVDQKELDIILQVKNYKHVYAGIGRSFQIGAASIIHNSHNFNFALDFILFAICFIASIYHLLLFLFRKNNKELLYFSVLCLSVGMRTLLSNETILMKLLPDLPFLIGSKIVTLTIPLCVISTLLYVQSLYREDAPKKPLEIIAAAQIVYLIMVLLCDSYLYSIVFIPYLLTVFAASLYIIYVSVLITIRHRPDYLYYTFGVLLITSGSVTDILVFLRVIDTNYFLSYFVALFILVQTILIGRRYLYAARNIETLSNDLKQSLHKIENTETAFLNAQIKPHFLYNALNTIAECCQSDPKEAEELILSLAKYLRYTLNFENLGNTVPLKKELELISTYWRIEKARFHHINLEMNIDEALLNYPIPPLILQPIVENAIKHGIRDNVSESLVIIKISQTKDHILFIIEDNGIGIEQQVLSELLTCPAKTQSIGLYNIHSRLKQFYNSGLSLRSTIGVGTVVQFEIPKKEI